MSTETGHAHAFRRDTTSLCRCGMTAEQYQLQQAVDNISGDASFKHKIIVLPSGTTPDPQPIAGQIVITWPKPIGPFPSVLVSDQISVANADTGEPILTVTGFTAFNVHAEVGDIVVAELVTLADADGQPILDANEIKQRMAITDNGDIATTTSWWHVAEMRIAE